MDQRFLEPSPHAADGGELIGRLPTSIPVEDLRSLGQPERPTKAIRTKCLDCCGGSQTEVRKCVSTRCSLWPFRMGRNPFWGKNEAADDENGSE
jgi:hypothetical protein